MDTIAVVDFGGQYAHLIANRLRRLGVYSEIVLPEEPVKTFKKYKGIILSGGPASVYADDAPTLSKEFFSIGIPILGLCYGHQLMQYVLGGFVKSGKANEYGVAYIDIVGESVLFKGLPKKQKVWMSHGDHVETLAEGFTLIASTEKCPTAAISNEKKKMYGFQFHPEVTHTEHGNELLKRFIFDVCTCKKSWDIKTFYKSIEHDIKKQVGKKKVFLLVSGGIDSTVCFALLNKVLGPERVYGVLIDHGFMRKNEADEVKKILTKSGFKNFRVYNAVETFMKNLDHITDPEEKRKIIGKTFLHVKDQVIVDMNLNPDEWIIAQGTIYPDTIETGGTKHADTIKTHHNRVSEAQILIEEGKIIEPIKQLYKDEVRHLGKVLKLPDVLLKRHPFPGPGLAIRALCVAALDEIVGENVEQIDAETWKIPLRSVGVQGDGRTYAHPAVMIEPLSYDEFENHSTHLTNTNKSFNRVLWRVAYKGKWNNFHVHARELEKPRIDLLREVDAFVMERMKETGLYDTVWQFPVILIPFGEFNESIVLRPINSTEAMTANFSRISEDFVTELAEEIVQQFPIDAVFYDITNKPPGTIEWE